MFTKDICPTDLRWRLTTLCVGLKKRERQAEEAAYISTMKNLNGNSGKVEMTHCCPSKNIKYLQWINPFPFCNAMNKFAFSCDQMGNMFSNAMGTQCIGNFLSIWLHMCFDIISWSRHRSMRNIKQVTAKRVSEDTKQFSNSFGDFGISFKRIH